MLIFELAKRDFKERYVASVLGIWWAFLWPLVNILIYTVIFGKLLGTKLSKEHSTIVYGVYIASGIIPWTFFSNLLVRLTNIFIEKAGYISKVPIKLETYILAVTLAELISLAIHYFFLSISVFILFGLNVQNLVNFLWANVLLILFALCLGIPLGILNVFIRDVKEIVNVSLQLWFWLTPIVYMYNILPNWVKPLVTINPMFYIIEMNRTLFLKDYEVPFTREVLINLFYILLIALLVSYFFLKRAEKDIRDSV